MSRETTRIDPSDLYGLPLERFVPERNALAKTLRREGRADEAARIGSLRKPSVAAWAVNQVVRTQRRTATELFEAGDRLQRAQSELLAGQGQVGQLRDAAAQVRAAVDELTGAARGLLTSSGHELTLATLERVSETLHAAALDEEAREAVGEACLERELRHVGLGAFGAVSVTRPEPKRAEPERAERLKVARRAEADAHRDLERARRALEDAQNRRDRAAAALQGAEEELARARERAEQAAAIHDRAQRTLDEL